MRSERLQLDITSTCQLNHSASLTMPGKDYAEIKIEGTGSKNKSKLFSAIIFLTIINVGLMVAVLCVSFLPVDWSPQSDGRASGAATCVACQQLREGLYDDETRGLDRFSKHTDKNGQEICCTRNAEDLPVVLSLLLERKLRYERAKGTFMVNKMVYIDGENNTKSMSNAKPAAHLLGFHGEGFAINRKPRTKIMNFPKNWNQDNQTFMVNGVDYNNGRLIIPDSGLFYVYSQVYFNRSAESNTSTQSGDPPDTHVLSHAVYRFNIRYPYTGEEKLLENAESVCQRHLGSNSEHTSYLGAVVSLRRGDEVFVKVSHLNLVSDETRSNYFGLYLV